MRNLVGGTGMNRRSKNLRVNLSVRNTLLVLGLVGALTAAGMASDLWLHAWQARQDAQWLRHVNEVESTLQKATQAWSEERLLVHVALGAFNSTFARRPVAARQAAGRGDAAFRLGELLSRGIGSTEAGERFARARNRLRQVDSLRRWLDSSPSSLIVTGKVEAMAKWFNAMNLLIDQTRRYGVSLRREQKAIAPALRAALEQRRAGWVMQEFAAREFTVIAGAMAAGDPLVLEDVERLTAYHGNLEQAWETIDFFGSAALTDPKLTKAIEDVRRVYFGTYRRLRDPVVLAGMQGAAYPLTVQEWLDRTGATLNVIVRLGKAAEDVARGLIQRQERESLSQLVFASAVLVGTIGLCAASLWVVVTWVVRPLDRITTTMSALAAGDPGAPEIPETQRLDEIGEMARAVADFKRSAEQRATEISRANTEIAALNRNLENRVRHRTAELAFARDQAIAASEAKSQFLANMSHEFRTPLTAIIGYCELQIEQAKRRTDAEAMADLDTIHTSACHLLALVDNVLDLAKIEAGRMSLDLEPYDLHSLVGDVVDAARPLAMKNDNKLAAMVEPGIAQVVTDPTKLRQALFNLVANACKFTEHGEVAVNVAALRDAGSLEIKVRDTGIGMSREDQARVFDAFVQGDSSTTKRYGGTGLGLTITRHICWSLGGDITARSAPGEGAEFTMILPLDARLASLKAVVA